MGHDPRVRLQAAVEHINRHHNTCDYCIISGDMVNRGSVDDYTAVAKLLGALTVPFLPMVGNHDDRQLFRSVFSLPKTCMENFVQYTVETTDGVIVCLDTLKAGSDEGAFCVQRQSWLRTVLKQAGAKPVYIFMHHPPMALGLPMQDGENLKDGAAFLQILADFSNVKYLFIGHVHRPITGTIKGIPFATMRSILYQAPPPQPEWDWSDFAPAKEAPNIGVITIDKSDVNLQYLQICSFGTGTEPQ